MRSTLFLSVCTATVLAQNSILDHSHVGICRSPLLSSLDFLFEKRICSPYGGALDNRRDEGHSTSTGPWSHSRCYRNGTDEFCMYTSTTFAENRGISILTTPERVAKFSKLRAFTDPKSIKDVNQDIVRTLPARYNVVPIPGKDMGVTAKQPLNRGDLIMSNTASMMIDYAAFETLPHADLQKIQAAGVDALPTAHRARFLNLSTHNPTEGYYQRVEKLLATNAFDIDVDDGGETEFFVVFPEIARFNHDCRPNADYWFDPETLTQYIHAVRPIAAGEEITISYMDPVNTRKNRMHKLHHVWGFKCSCSQCTKPRLISRDSDDRVRQIQALRADLQDHSGGSRATPQMAELFVSLFEQERLESMAYEAHTHAALEWNGVGEPWLATKHARLAIEHGLASVGPRNSDVVEMQALAEDPWSHWSWMSRTKRRMGWGRREESDDEEEED
ncbi:uncharacterized protein E0L32_009014 [Thyridium curvatum]|uniref:SET domain-containing protein n=1 Tax=Thyridium curvatum TaxID=1093900 RepID=A0A507APX6_9PEZI|nr:uncharacterized protein E0L32_009014 [Thyridium curvatum]TPX09823.1 hypothetical protein E0L32_009014 [Thyridium curvatum]